MAEKGRVAAKDTARKPSRGGDGINIGPVFREHVGAAN
jgi:hypothetical protein